MADLTAVGPAERHRRIAAVFGERVAAATNWDAPTPVADWVAGDIVGHLVEWFTGFLAGGGVSLPAGPPVAADPTGAWRRHSTAVQALIDDPDRASGEFAHPRVGSRRLDDTVDAFYTPDVFMHTWDLARATGQDDGLDQAYSAHLLAGMEPIEDIMRGSGQYGPPVAVPVDADAATRLLGFIGRDPAWRPPP